MKYIIFLIICVIAFSCQNEEKPTEKPNVVVIFTDDMNFEDIGAYGGKVLTPCLDSLIRKGVSFSNFYDCSAVCSPSRYNILTGRYASRCFSLQKQYPTSDPAFLRWNIDIENGERTIAHVMNENGYVTGLVGKYHNFQNEQIQDNIPEDADATDENIQKRISNNYNMLKDSIQKLSGFQFVKNVYVNNLHALALPKSMQHHNMEWITQGAVDFIDKNSGKPFFLYMATTLPHVPAPVESMNAAPRITPSGMLDEAPDVQPSRNDIFKRIKEAGLEESKAPYTWLDDGIGAVLKKLEEKKLLENTIILFASDHGGNNAKMTCYEEGVRAPAFAYWKGQFPEGKELEQIIANIDFAPTIYQLCGIKPAKNDVIDGKSFLPLINGESVDWRDDLFLEITYSRAVVTKDWKYIAVRFPDSIKSIVTENPTEKYNQEGTLYSANNPDGKMKVRYNADKLYPHYFDRDQLYNLKDDNKEQVNLANNPMYKGKLFEMKAKLKSYESDFPHAFGEFKNEEK